MEKTIISTNHAPAAIGPYSQAVKIGDFIFTSGQIPIDPQTGNMPKDIQAQTKQVLENIKALLQEAGSEMKNVIKTTVFLNDMNNFSKMNEVYGTYFLENAPARSTVEISRLPKDAMVEIEVIAKI